jgi:hypothetical protein
MQPQVAELLLRPAFMQALSIGPAEAIEANPIVAPNAQSPSVVLIVICTALMYATGYFA